MYIKGLEQINIFSVNVRREALCAPGHYVAMCDTCTAYTVYTIQYCTV